MRPEDYLKDCKVRIGKGNFSILQTHQIPSDFVAAIVDHQETTVVIESSKVKPDQCIQESKGWKMLTFDVVLPFELVGFLALVARHLAEVDISIFVLSSYSTDHIMVKNNRLEQTKEVLANLGCQIIAAE